MNTDMNWKMLLAALILMLTPLVGSAEELSKEIFCIPLGWSQDGKFAYTVAQKVSPFEEESENLVGEIEIYYYVVQDMVTDKVLLASEPVSDKVLFTEKMAGAASELQTKYGIQKGPTEIWQLSYNNNMYIIDDEKGIFIIFSVDWDINADDNTCTIDARLQPEGKRKTLTRIELQGKQAAAIYFAGYAQSPFQKRIALAVIVPEAKAVQLDSNNQAWSEQRLLFVGCDVGGF
jgi:hypothetical protein